MYASTLASVKTHTLPEWYEHAKFGIFIHWTLSSVPAFAAAGTFGIGQMLSGKGDLPVQAAQPAWLLETGQPVEWTRTGNRFSLDLPGTLSKEDIPVYLLNLEH